MTSKIEELAAAVAAHVQGQGAQPTLIPDFYLSRCTTTRLPRQTTHEACLCVVAQGAKRITFETKTIVYNPSKYFLSTLAVPGVSQVVQATPQKPLLCATLLLDFAEIHSLIAKAKLSLPQPPAIDTALFAPRADDEIVDALIRMTRLLARPEQISILAPLIRREIYFRLLTGRHGGLLWQMSVGNGKVQRIAKGIEWLRTHSDRIVTMRELAHEIGMSAPAMHQSFRAATSMSPLQFHKNLRLQRARAIMVSESVDALTAAQRVGYASPSQFNREYRRLFGASPLRDVERIRAIQLHSLAGDIERGARR